MPFTAAQFFDVFRSYNSAVWPAQFALIGVALWLVAGLSRTPRRLSRSIGVALAGLWVWMAVAYHAIFFARINPLAYVFAALFLIQAAALVWHGLKTGRLLPDAQPARMRRALGLIVVLYALVGYPLIGFVFGQRYPALPTFGLPCPTTIFTLGIFLWCARPVPWTLYIVPAVWAGIATSAAMLFGVAEDLALLPALAVSLALSVRRSSGQTVVTQRARWALRD